MKHSDIAALMKGVAPVIRDYVSAAIEPLLDRIAELEKQIAETEALDAAVSKAIEAIPFPADGKDVDMDEVTRLIADAVSRLPPAKEGPPGKLPVVKGWSDQVHNEGDVVTHAGATYQAVRDTGKAPPHDDWQCIAAAGRDGVNGRTFRIRGTHTEGSDYLALDVVSLNGGAFVAKADDPGPCPGDGWQLIASQGKRGQPGERGLPGRGDRGPAGEPLVAAHIDEQGMLTLVNADGTTVGCDLYPLLSKLGAH